MKKIIGYSVVACLIVCLGCHTHKHKATSAVDKKQLNIDSYNGINRSTVAQQIIKKIFNPYSDIVISETNAIPSGNQYEEIYIPPPIEMSDGFSYKLTIDHKEKKYWYTRMGGIAGTVESFGPIEFGK